MRAFTFVSFHESLVDLLCYMLRNLFHIIAYSNPNLLSCLRRHHRGASRARRHRILDHLLEMIFMVA